ncbi:MAG: peptidase T [Deltaproteobacteria bacterium]|nr:peptidase T [Deltaproteobacteria bacterium]
MLDQTTTLSRFLSYVQVETQSDAHSQARPSTPGQLVLLEQLRQEMLALGLVDVELTAGAFLLGTLPGNTDGPAFGLIAHVDTAPGCSGDGVSPQLHADYQGGDIELKDGVVILASENPELALCLGETLITADGTTLLGADDKAGVAIAMGVVEYLIAHPELPRPSLRIAFTPDEEIGRGAHGFPYERFGATAAITLDGGFSGELNVETFNADAAWVRVTGVPTHPGTAKGKLVNAITWLARLIERLPADERPETTEGYQGFFHVTEVEGDATEATAQLILRDFDAEALAARGALLRALAGELITQEPRLRVTVSVEPSYRNMRPALERQPALVEQLLEATRLAEVEPRVLPIRGGTDGAMLTAGGLPCPNVFAGGVNFHGPTEWICTRSLGESMAVVLHLVQLRAGA